MAIKGHEKIRELIALAAAEGLTTAEQKQVAEHMRSCASCSNELEIWQSIAIDLCRLPTPQPSPGLVQATLARAQQKLAEQADHDWNSRAMIFVVAFAWLLTLVSWPVLHFVRAGFRSLLGLQFGDTWVNFATFTALAWLVGGTAAVIITVRHRREGKFA